MDPAALFSLLRSDMGNMAQVAWGIHCTYSVRCWETPLSQEEVQAELVLQQRQAADYLCYLKQENKGKTRIFLEEKSLKPIF